MENCHLINTFFFSLNRRAENKVYFYRKLKEKSKIRTYYYGECIFKYGAISVSGLSTLSLIFRDTSYPEVQEPSTLARRQSPARNQEQATPKMPQAPTEAPWMSGQWPLAPRNSSCTLSVRDLSIGKPISRTHWPYSRDGNGCFYT